MNQLRNKIADRRQISHFTILIMYLKIMSSVNDGPNPQIFFSFLPAVNKYPELFCLNGLFSRVQDKHIYPFPRSVFTNDICADLSYICFWSPQFLMWLKKKTVELQYISTKQFKISGIKQMYSDPISKARNEMNGKQLINLRRGINKLTFLDCPYNILPYHHSNMN